MILEISAKIIEDARMVFRNAHHNIAIPMKQASNCIRSMAMVYLTVPTKDIGQRFETSRA
jgi:hypothetical protein